MNLRICIVNSLWIVTLAITSSCIVAEKQQQEPESRTGTIIGIDLGTTYSCVGVFHQGRVEIIANDQGNRITPSYVAFTDEGRLVGDAAKHQATVNVENTVFDVKRLIGRKFNDESVQSDKKLMPYEIVNVQDKPFIQIKQGDGTLHTFAPEEVSAMILAKMKLTAESFLGRTIDRAVVTVPAYFNDEQRHATRDAGVIAGLHVERIINEPTAAAIAYGMDKKGDESTVLVFDLGGGTFDVTILLIDNGAFQVLATNGDTHLGGEDFDQRVMMYFVDQIKAKDNIDISDNKRALQVLRKEVERAKRALSTQYKARLDVEDLVSGYHLSETLTRAKFEELNLELFKKTLGPVKLVMEDALLEISEIDEIVMVGGSTRIPKVQQLVAEYFGGKEPNTGINPDEAVAFGAAIQASVLSGEGGDAVKDVVLLDVTPLSLGTETKGGVMNVLIPRGTTIPTEKTKSFYTIENNQEVMTIDVYEGERSRVKDNHLLGLFELTDIPKAPRGDIEVQITYKVDANGMLEVTASLVGSKNVKTVTIEPESGRLSQQEIDRMVEESKRFAEEDAKARERIEARNSLESLAYDLSSKLESAESNKRLSVEGRKTLADAIDETLGFLEDSDMVKTDEFIVRRSELESLSASIFKNSNAAEGDDGDYRVDGDDEL